MFLVGGGILTHGVPPLHHAIEHTAEATAGLPGGDILSALLPSFADAVIGVIAGAIALAAVSGINRLRQRPAH